MSGPRCPRCGSTDCAPCVAELYASDERFDSTHECRGCHTKFRHTPGAWSSTAPWVEPVYREGKP